MCHRRVASARVGVQPPEADICSADSAASALDRRPPSIIMVVIISRLFIIIIIGGGGGGDGGAENQFEIGAALMSAGIRARVFIIALG